MTHVTKHDGAPGVGKTTALSDLVQLRNDEFGGQSDD